MKSQLFLQAVRARKTALSLVGVSMVVFTLVVFPCLGLSAAAKTTRELKPYSNGAVVCPTCRNWGYGQNWVYSGYGTDVGLSISGGTTAIAALSAPNDSSAVISATSSSSGPALYVNNSTGGLAFRFDGNGILNGALSASNLAVSGAANVGNGLTVNGEMKANGDLTVAGTLNLNGGLNLGNFNGPLSLSAQVNGDGVVKSANTATDAVAAGVYGYAPNGRGVVGASQNGVGVMATANGAQPALSANNPNGPAFQFSNYGSIQANSSSQPALAISNQSGTGLQVTGNASITTGNSTALTVAGTGSQTIKAQNNGGVAVEGDATTGVGVYGNSTSYNGVVAQNDNSLYPALYAKNSAGGTAAEFDGDTIIKGNLTVTGSKGGFVVDVARNDGPDNIEAGDLVIITGSAPAVIGNIPVPTVKKADSAYATGVIGVANQHYSVKSGSYDNGAIAPGEYFSIVTLGAFQTVKVDTSNGPIAPGDLLVASGTNPGYAMKASMANVNGVPIAPAGVVGKALGSLSKGKGVIPLVVTLK